MNKSDLKRLYAFLREKSPLLADYCFRAYHGGLLRRTKRRIRGAGHRLWTHRSAVLKNVTFDIRGSGHCIEIGENCIMRNVRVRIIGESNRIKLTAAVQFSEGGCLWMEDTGGVIDIGRGATFGDCHLAVTGIGCKITIGEDCMFSSDIDIRTGDSHAVVDGQGRKINPEASVTIGNHVWVGSHSSILKGSRLGDNSIVATRSTVTRSFDEGNILVGGSPAVKIKAGISWRRARFPVAEKSPPAGPTAVADS